MRKSSYIMGSASAHGTTRTRAGHDLSAISNTPRNATVISPSSGRTSGPRPMSTQVHHAAFVPVPLEAGSGSTWRHSAHQDAPSHATESEPSSPEVAKSQAGGRAANTRRPAGKVGPSPTTRRQSRAEPAAAKAKPAAVRTRPQTA